MSLFIKYFELEPIISFPNGIDLQKFGNKTMEHLSGVIGLTLKPMVQSVGEADFSKGSSFTVAVTAVAAVACVHCCYSYRWPALSSFIQGSVLNASLVFTCACTCIHNSCEVGTIIILILEVRKPKDIEVK